MKTSALALVALLLAACGGASFKPPPPPSEDAARAYLQSVVRIVQSGDVTSLCQLGSGTCGHDLAQADRAAVPHTPPTVVGTRAVPSAYVSDGTWSVGGRLLKLCGRDGRDKPYYSEMLVFQDSDRLISTGTVFWLGTRIADGQSTDGAPPPCPA